MEDYVDVVRKPVGRDGQDRKEGKGKVIMIKVQ